MYENINISSPSYVALVKLLGVLTCMLSTPLTQLLSSQDRYELSVSTKAYGIHTIAVNED